MKYDKDGLTPQQAATRSKCTPDFIAGVKYAMRLAERDSVEFLEELDVLGDKARIEDYDELTSLALELVALPANSISAYSLWKARVGFQTQTC